ncbi:MAG: FAD-binding oxidoreductase [Actinobacteria bacterium]|nr:FAD-binding oxidoreductase [Actinomycetota bacterium]
MGTIRPLPPPPRDLSGEFRSDLPTRELYAADASIYRRRPAAALRAGLRDDLAAALAWCRTAGLPLTMRGAGTSLAGQSVGTGLVVDTSALSACRVDPDRRLAVVEPGVVLNDLNAAAAEHGLIFGPDVATSSRATLGGMIANNSAGARSIVHGLTADSVERLEILFADGTHTWIGRSGAVPPALASCRGFADAWRGPSLLRRVSGYRLDALRGDRPDWARFLCGSEGTLGIVTRAEVALAPIPDARGLALLRFSSVDDALDAVPDLIRTSPSAIELLDAPMLDPRNRPPATAGLADFGSDAAAMLVVEFSGAIDEVRASVTDVEGGIPVLDPAAQAAVWTVRRAGIARALRGDDGSRPSPDAKPLPFIEDPAVPPECLAGFAREVRRVLAEESLPAVWYGHASVGCLHIRPLLDLRAPGAVAVLRRVAETVADLVAANGGSLSGEHGDGRLRSELLSRMYPPETLTAFRAVKDALDPDRLLNPGIIVDAEPLDSGLRVAAAPRPGGVRTMQSFESAGGFGRAVEACNGNGTCRAATGTMCPSYQALGDERHSTRGRAVLLRAAVEGRLPDGLGDDGLHEALDLCLACTACATECPASVDMAALKAEALAQRHARTGTPARARVIADLQRALAIGGRLPRPLVRAGVRVLGRVVGREVPVPGRPWRDPGRPVDDADVVLMADTFTTHLSPEVGRDAVKVLEAAGHRVHVAHAGCCGRPAFSQGVLATAARQAARMVAALAPFAERGTPVLLLEPSCASMLLKDAPRLLGSTEARRVAGSIESFEGFLRVRTLPVTAAAPRTVHVHRHCHSPIADDGSALVDLMASLPGVNAIDTAAGCCGMAGAFGYEHPGLSRTIAARRLLPALEAAEVVVAHGSSCRSQIAELAGLPAIHPASFIAGRLP